MKRNVWLVLLGFQQRYVNIVHQIIVIIVDFYQTNENVQEIYVLILFVVVVVCVVSACGVNMNYKKQQQIYLTSHLVKNKVHFPLYPQCEKNWKKNPLKKKTLMYSNRRHLLSGKGYFLDAANRKEPQSLFNQCDKLFVLDKPQIGNTKSRVHRSIGIFSDNAAGYWVSKQSNWKIDAQPLPDFLKTELKEVNQFFEEEFNLIILNKYQNHEESIGPHSDDSEFNGKYSVITVSLGATRIYRLVDRDTKKRQIDNLVASGDVIIMSNSLQLAYTHEIPIHPTPCGPRISLTFRRVLPNVEHFSRQLQPKSSKECLVCKGIILNSGCPVCKKCLPLKKFRCPDCGIKMPTPWLCCFCYISSIYTEDGMHLLPEPETIQKETTNKKQKLNS